MNKEKSHLEKYAPKGIQLEKEVMAYVMLMTFAFFYSITFVQDYLDARSDLYEWIGGEKVLIAGKMMSPFFLLLDDCFLGFVLVIAGMIGILIYHYIYHYQGSKSIYLMKRLPKKGELHRRCLTLPVAGIVSVVFSVLILYVVYYGVYFIFTPQQCLPL